MEEQNNLICPFNEKPCMGRKCMLWSETKDFKRCIFVAINTNVDGVFKIINTELNRIINKLDKIK